MAAGQSSGRPYLRELFAEVAEPGEPHVDRDGLAPPGQSRPVQVHGAILEVSRNEHAGMGIVAMGQGNPGVTRHPGRCGDTVDNLEEMPLAWSTSASSPPRPKV